MQQLYHVRLVISSENCGGWAHALLHAWRNVVGGVGHRGLLYLLGLPRQKILYIGIDKITSQPSTSQVVAIVSWAFWTPTPSTPPNGATHSTALPSRFQQTTWTSKAMPPTPSESKPSCSTWSSSNGNALSRPLSISAASSSKPS